MKVRETTGLIGQRGVWAWRPIAGRQKIPASSKLEGGQPPDCQYRGLRSNRLAAVLRSDQSSVSGFGTQRDSGEGASRKRETREQQMGRRRDFGQKAWAISASLTRIWKQALNNEERERLLRRCYCPSGERLNSPTSVEAENLAYKVPIPKRK